MTTRTRQAMKVQRQPRPCVFLEGECMETTSARWATCWARCWTARWDARWADRWEAVRPVGLRSFAGRASSVSEARGWVRGLLTGGIAEGALDDVVLLLSEVVTNAVVHSESGRREDGLVTVRIGVGRGVVHVEVIDAGSAASVPTVRGVDAERVGGRGLFLVDLLAVDWGVRHSDTGGAVWFQVGYGLPGGGGAALTSRETPRHRAG
ncbi:ATP-binding protein [Streptosporangium sp. NPDC051022]|uniref:ATP-binding protein n=1 Tax=Streptosporangium sp. NPDC051022 TaxID=3155752 RepID=UPI003421B4D2